MVELALRLDPHSANVLMERGAIAYFRNLHEEALPDLRRAAQLWPDFLPTYLILAGVHVARDRLGEAANAVAEILRLAPGYSVSFMNRQVPGSDCEGRLSADLRRAGLPE